METMMMINALKGNWVRRTTSLCQKLTGQATKKTPNKQKINKIKQHKVFGIVEYADGG